MKHLAFLAVMLFATPALAQDKPAADQAKPAAQEPVKAPSADAVKSTWDYFYKGQGQGPVLVDARLCTEVAKEGPNKFECVTEVSPDGVKADKGVRARCTTVLSGAPTDIDILMVGDGHFRITQTRVRNP